MILKYFLVAWFTLGMVATIVMVGKPRKPTTPGTAATSAVITLGLIAAVLCWWPS